MNDNDLRAAYKVIGKMMSSKSWSNIKLERTLESVRHMPNEIFDGRFDVNDLSVMKKFDKAVNTNLLADFYAEEEVIPSGQMELPVIQSDIEFPFDDETRVTCKYINERRVMTEYIVKRRGEDGADYNEIMKEIKGFWLASGKKEEAWTTLNKGGYKLKNGKTVKYAATPSYSTVRTIYIAATQ